MQSISFLDNQQLVVTAQPEDSAGDASANFNPAIWAVADPTVVSVTNISADGLTATLVALKVGATTVTVTGSTGNGGTAFSSTFGVTINPNVPTQFNFVFAAPTTQA
jgi:Pilus formation protein N terminal region